MTKEDIKEGLGPLKCKNSKGFDISPQKILLNGTEILVDPLTNLFDKIYHQKSIPGSSLAMQLQSIIGRALDEDKFVQVASLDLSAAIDKVNINLLIKRLKIVGCQWMWWILLWFGSKKDLMMSVLME
jgi:hypothetical protein